ncbi:MAG: hypothetical protein M0T85_05275 [Dehalococcoidales bacterium]|nr:hypothetical protein [Dehalococcoidales bacterium]
MEEAIYNIRMAAPEDLEQIRTNIRRTMANPDGKTLRKGLADAMERREMLVLERVSPREKTGKVSAFIEWRTRVDGPITIRDIGTAGDEPNEGMAKRLVRELLRIAAPPEAHLKIRADLEAWNNIFDDLPGFQLEGREYSRPHWKTVWKWTPEAERRERPRERLPRGQMPRGMRR